MRIAVTGAGGRLGRAIVHALKAAPMSERAGLIGGAGDVIAWSRTDFDLDSPASIGGLLDVTGAEIVVHAAAWTDVDGCALDPALAERRNGVATGILAAAAAERGLGLVVISTNEVFDGKGSPRPYEPRDHPRPANAYGASKLAGERAAVAAYAHAISGRDPRGRRGMLGIARTAWLFGPGAPDFPLKIARTAQRAAAAGERLRLVGDEVGSPTFAEDVAAAIVAMLDAGAFGGVHHLVNAGTASRADWGRDVLKRLAIDVQVEEVPLETFVRPSRPPLWGVLAATPLPDGAAMRHWQDAMKAYEPALLRSAAEPA